jgi:hypothetical protein
VTSTDKSRGTSTLRICAHPQAHCLEDHRIFECSNVVSHSILSPVLFFLRRRLVTGGQWDIQERCQWTAGITQVYLHALVGLFTVFPDKKDSKKKKEDWRQDCICAGQVKEVFGTTRYIGVVRKKTIEDRRCIGDVRSQVRSQVSEDTWPETWPDLCFSETPRPETWPDLCVSETPCPVTLTCQWDLQVWVTVCFFLSHTFTFSKFW